MVACPGLLGCIRGINLFSYPINLLFGCFIGWVPGHNISSGHAWALLSFHMAYCTCQQLMCLHIAGCVFCWCMCMTIKLGRYTNTCSKGGCLCPLHISQWLSGMLLLQTHKPGCIHLSVNCGKEITAQNEQTCRQGHRRG